MKIGLMILMFVIGAVMGSFLGCLAWRVRYRELKKKNPGKWSVCLHCGERLKWYDNIPIVSWLALKGKCRKCGKKIGVMEFLAELLTGLAFLGVTAMLNLDDMLWVDWATFVVSLLLILSLGFLAIYDGKWGELPVVGLVISGILALILIVLKQWLVVAVFGWNWTDFGNIVGSVLILGGTYLVLYLVSKGKWVGDGDWILAGILGLALGDMFLSLLTLFLANLLGCIIMYPVIKKRQRKRIYFGPFLVIAFVAVMIFGEVVRNWIIW